MEPELPADAERVAQLFGLTLDDDHLIQALTHPSFSNESKSVREDNQRLEFLGDAVLELCASTELYRRFPDADEGALTRMRAKLVNADALARWARKVELSPALRLGRGARTNGLAESRNVLADAVEALIAATYLDAGIESAADACRRVIDDGLQALKPGSGRDAKSELQERVQAVGAAPPVYEVVASGGPAHERWFEVEVRVEGQSLAVGRGHAKRVAERAAAQQALDDGAWLDMLDSRSEVCQDEGDGESE